MTIDGFTSCQCNALQWIVNSEGLNFSLELLSYKKYTHPNWPIVVLAGRPVIPSTISHLRCLQCSVRLLVRWQKWHLACNKTEWWYAGDGRFDCSRFAPVSEFQLWPLVPPWTISCFSKPQNGMTFWYRLFQMSGKLAIKGA